MLLRLIRVSGLRFAAIKTDSKNFSIFRVTFLSQVPLLLVIPKPQHFWSIDMKKRSKSRRQRNRTKSKTHGFGKLEDRKLMAGLIGSEAAVQPEPLATAEIVQSTPAEQLDSDSAIQRIVNGEQTSDYEAVGFVGPLGCTGTLISPMHVLTAAHCTEGVGNTQGRFEVNGQTYTTTRIYNHPDYNPNNFSRGDDLAIMELSRPVTGVTPMDIFRQTPQIGTMLTLVGFGEGGTSTGGYDPSDNGKQVGQTELEAVTAEHIAWNFDKHSEANTAPGDSGGPAFINSNGQMLIAGVTSGGDGDAHTLGDYSFDTRIDVHADWIDGIVGTTNGGGGGGQGGGTGADDHTNGANSNATTINLNASGVGNGSGVFEEVGDRDAFKFTIAADGETTITLTEDGSDVDTFLRVYDAGGNLIGQNDDFGGSYNSQLKLDLDAGNYFAVAGSYDDSDTGAFKLRVKHDAASVDDGYTIFSNNQTKEISEDGRDRVWSVIKVREMTGEISDINVTVDIDHTWVGDLRLILIAPDRTRIVLVNRQGDDGSNFDNTTFDSQATTHINHGVAPFRGTFRPAHNLNQLSGQDPNGRWLLMVHDLAAGDGGQLNGWSMDIQTDTSRKGGNATPNLAENDVDHDRIDNVATATQPAEAMVQSGLSGSESQDSSDGHANDMCSRFEVAQTTDASHQRRSQLLDSVFSDDLLAGV